jgi:hypothetical protein
LIVEVAAVSECLEQGTGRPRPAQVTATAANRNIHIGRSAVLTYKHACSAWLGKLLLPVVANVANLFLSPLRRDQRTEDSQRRILNERTARNRLCVGTLTLRSSFRRTPRTPRERLVGCKQGAAVLDTCCALFHECEFRRNCPCPVGLALSSIGRGSKTKTLQPGLSSGSHRLTGRFQNR